jgi:hypothetical protein
MPGLGARDERAQILEYVWIDEGATGGGGAVVTKDVLPDLTKGSPRETLESCMMFDRCLAGAPMRENRLLPETLS